MRNFKNKVFKTYNLLFILSFGLARGLPLLVFFLAAHILTANQYVNLENMFAVSQLVLSFASFGISGLLAVVNQTKNNKDIINRHIQIVSLILFLISTIIYFTNYYLILNVLNILIILLITHSTSTLLKINKKRIFGLGSECLIYSFILVLFIFFYFNKVKFEYEFLQKNFFYFLSLIYLIIHFFYYGQKIILKISFNAVIRLYKRSYGLFISGIIISFISLYPRVFIKYFPEDQQFDFIYVYRIAFFGFIVHQLFSTFFYRNIFKSRWLKIIKLIGLVVSLTFIASLFFVLFYIYLSKFDNLNLTVIEFNFFIIVQIFLVSLVNYIQIILLRSSKTIYFYKRIFFTYLSIFIISLLLFKYLSLDIIYLSFAHILIMMSYIVISYKFLVNNILSKNIFLKK
jgi:hypothetical protein